MNDEQTIRDLIKRWVEASARQDLDELMTLMDPDVIFLVPGQPPMRGRDAFASSFKAAAAQFEINAVSEVNEINVADGFAYCWTNLEVTLKPLSSGQAMRRTGHTLTVFRKGADGHWVLFRDANLLGPPAPVQ